MPGGNNPNNSVGGGWHLTHNMIQQIYSYSAHSGQSFDEVKRNPNVKCKDNKLIYEATYKMDGKSNQIDTGIFFSDMMSYLFSKPKNKNDNSYNTKTTLPLVKEKSDATEEAIENNLTVSLKEIDLPKQNKGKKTGKRKDKKKSHYVNDQDFN